MSERTHKKSNWLSTPQNQDSALKLRRFATKDDKDEEIQQSPDINLSKFSLPTNSPFPDSNIQRQEEGEKEEGEETPGAQLKSDKATAEEPEEEIQTKSEEPKQEDDEVVQTKLTVGEPGDKYEQEADTVAAKVVEHINSPKSQQPVQGKVEPVVQATLMRQGGAGGGTVNRDVEQNIQQARGGGQGLADNVRQPMEQAFGADFSGVKVHTGGQADVLNRSLNSRAFATGQDIFFKQGEYQPGSRGGQELLAHELTHVVQQGGGVQTQVQRECGVDESCIEEPSSYTKEKTDNSDLIKKSTSSQKIGYGMSYDFNDLPSETKRIGNISLTFSMIGNLKLAQNYSDNVIASKEGIELSAENVLGTVINTSNIQIKPESIVITNGIGQSFKGYKTSSEFSFQTFPPCYVHKYKCEPEPIALSYKGWSISGNMGYEIDVKIHLDDLPELKEYKKYTEKILIKNEQRLKILLLIILGILAGIALKGGKPVSPRFGGTPLPSLI